MIIRRVGGKRENEGRKKTGTKEKLSAHSPRRLSRLKTSGKKDKKGSWESGGKNRVEKEDEGKDSYVSWRLAVKWVASEMAGFEVKKLVKTGLISSAWKKKGEGGEGSRKCFRPPPRLAS